MGSTKFKQIILDEVSKVLTPIGFKKSNSHFTLSNGDLKYYVGFQSSKYSTSSIMTITFNIGIASELLYRIQGKTITSHLQGHYVKRIGDYLEESKDKWWEVDSANKAHVAAAEIATIITNRVIPEFNSLTKTEDLINIWLDEVASNQVNIEAQQYLVLLHNAKSLSGMGNDNQLN